VALLLLSMTHCAKLGFDGLVKGAPGPAPSGLPLEGSVQISARYCGSSVGLQVPGLLCFLVARVKLRDELGKQAAGLCLLPGLQMQPTRIAVILARSIRG
jgi:hypothetical protein